MIKKYSPISLKLPKMLHGADYNPEQWLEHPEILEEDIRLMKLAQCNVMSVGIFSWACLEPEEGIFRFEWLDQVINKLYEAGIYIILATPSGARPAWMSQKYPEVLRTQQDRVHNLHGGRHNHCFSSPIYREKVRIINQKLAERYGQHPAVIAWHISNEYGGDCHCEYCQEAFRTWLKNRYHSLEELNKAWWTTFWSHTYTSWEQIESPSSKGERSVHGLNLDWRRFVTDQTIDFIEAEKAPLKAVNPDIPCVINMMELFSGLNYWKVAEHVDIISWDSYPLWHRQSADDIEEGMRIAMVHDLFRSLKGGKPFMLMESTPSLTNWQKICKPKKPGLHLLSSVQAVAHGSDTVQYFQWRKSRGSFEKFHGAVVDHCGHEHTRVFREVAQVGDYLNKLDEIVGTSVESEVAILFDWENRWALEDAKALRNGQMNYIDSVLRHYKVFWEKGIPVDFVCEESDFSKYKVLITPMMYMVREGVAERIEDFVKQGGQFVATYWSGIVDQSDLCFLGGFPGPLRKTLGIWSEEIDALYDGEKNTFVYSNGEGDVQSYEAIELCDVIHTEGAKIIGTYTSDYYEGMPAVTVNTVDEGKAYYIATKSDHNFYESFYKSIIEICELKRAPIYTLPKGVTAQLREDKNIEYTFIMNFTKEIKEVVLENKDYYDMITMNGVKNQIQIKPYEVVILKSDK